MKIIEFKGVSKYYSDRAVVKDFSLGIEQGERTGIIGHSGCGKTTVLRLLAGFTSPDAGSIAVEMSGHSGPFFFHDTIAFLIIYSTPGKNNLKQLRRCFLYQFPGKIRP